VQIPTPRQLAWILQAAALCQATRDRIEASKRLLAETDHLVRRDRAPSAREEPATRQPPEWSPAGFGSGVDASDDPYALRR
jgi:hypothetical protein